MPDTPEMRFVELPVFFVIQDPTFIIILFLGMSDGVKRSSERDEVVGQAKQAGVRYYEKEGGTARPLAELGEGRVILQTKPGWG